MSDRYWVGGTADWDGTAGTKWSTTSGGGGGSAVPSSSDDVYLDANSGAVTITIATGGASCASLICTGFTGTLAGGGAVSLLCYGSFTLDAGMTWTYSGHVQFRATATGKTITSAGKNLNSLVTFNGVGGGWTLQDAFEAGTTGTRTITLTNGALDTNGQTVHSNTGFSSNNSNTRSLTLGASVVTLAGGSTVMWDFNTTTGLTFSGASSTLKFSTTSSRTFNGGGLTYGTVQLSNAAAVGDFTITGNNTFGTFSSLRTGAYSIKLTDGSNQTITTWSVNGSAGNLVTLTNTAATTAGTLTKAGGGTVTVDYANISWCTGSPGSTWIATNSINGGNNSGWNFGGGLNALLFGSPF